MARTYWTDSRIDNAFGELRQDLRGLRGEMDGLRAELHGDMAALRSELHADMGSLRADFHREFADLRKQLLAGSIAIIVALIGVIGAILVSQ